MISDEKKGGTGENLSQKGEREEMDLSYLDVIIDWNQNIFLIIIKRQGSMSTGFAYCKMLDVHGSWPQTIITWFFSLSSLRGIINFRMVTDTKSNMQMQCWDRNKEKLLDFFNY